MGPCGPFSIQERHSSRCCSAAKCKSSIDSSTTRTRLPSSSGTGPSSSIVVPFNKPVFDVVIKGQLTTGGRVGGISGFRDQEGAHVAVGMLCSALLQVGQSRPQRFAPAPAFLISVLYYDRPEACGSDGSAGLAWVHAVKGVMVGRRGLSPNQTVREIGGTPLRHPFTVNPFFNSDSRTRARRSPWSSTPQSTTVPPVPHARFRS